MLQVAPDLVAHASVPLSLLVGRDHWKRTFSSSDSWSLTEVDWLRPRVKAGQATLESN